MKRVTLLSLLLCVILYHCSSNSTESLQENSTITPTPEPTPEPPSEDPNAIYMNIVRPIKTDFDYFPCDVEHLELMFEAHHPDGVKQVRLIGIDAKVPSEPWTTDFNPESGYFYKERRYKSAGDRKYYLELETDLGEIVRSEDIFVIDNLATVPGSNTLGVIPTYQGFINVKDGDELAADTPLYIGVDCMDPDGGFLVEDNLHVADDLNGILWVKLFVDGELVEKKTNSTESPLTVDSETAARSFGLYEFFNVSLFEGSHVLEIKSSDREGNINSGTSITVNAVAKTP